MSTSFGESTPDHSVQDAYDAWAEQYDSDENATRDQNADVLREQLDVDPGDEVLELGCGTGLNTEWLAGRAGRVVAVDFSEVMLEKARRRLAQTDVSVRQVGVREP